MFTFYEILKNLRITNNLTQKQIANELELAERQYRRYENNEQQPTLPIVIKIADYFNVSLDYLVGRSDNPEINK